MSSFNNKPLNRLGQSDGFVKPKQTTQERLTPEQIKEKLLDYVLVENTQDNFTIPLNCHVRYFSVSPKNDKLFRLGGTVFKIFDDYIILSNGTTTWSVQKKNTIFYKKLSMDEVVLRSQKEKDVYDFQIKDMKGHLEQASKTNEMLRNENIKQKQIIKKLVNKIEKQIVKIERLKEKSSTQSSSHREQKIIENDTNGF